MDDYFESISQQFQVKISALGGRDYALGLGLMALASLLVATLAVMGRVSRFRPFGATELWEYVFTGALSLMMVGFLGMLVALERDTRNLKKGLPQAQMRFALCYRLVKELKYFQNDELPRHLDEARTLWRILFMYLYWMLNPSREQLMLSRKQQDPISGREQPPMSHRRLPPADFPVALELERFSSSYPWLQLSSDSKLIIQAFSEVHSKISARLRDGVSVPQLMDALNHLLVFFFSLIPAKAADPEITPRALLAFAQTIVQLPPYATATHPNLFSRIASTLYSMLGAFAHQNALVGAGAWYSLVMPLYSLGMLVALRLKPNLELTGVLISSWIGVPLAIAVGAAVAMAKRSK